MMKVFIVDDNKIFAEAISIALKKKFNYEFITYTNSNIMEDVISQSPELIISDYNFQENTILELMEKVNALNKKVKFIIITGAATTKQMVDILKLDPHDLIEKDIDFMNNLIESISKI